MPCNNAECNAGDVCCHGDGDPAGDFCAQPGGCGNAAELSCAGPADCPAGAQCCGLWNGFDWTGSYCTTDPCPSNLFCAGAPEACPPGWTCTFSDMLGAGYEWCVP
ncbi:MAG: hypothetical protein IT372_26360 [Polyangiaceae bacterium]|nr:hypothetical protein [Polyangiaceae bacterium]